MKRREVYFKNENDAEAALAELDRLKVSNARVEDVPKGTLKNNPFIPLAPSFGGPSGLEASPLKNKEKLEGKKEYTPYLLSFDVEDEDDEEAMSILKKRDSYTQNPDA